MITIQTHQKIVDDVPQIMAQIGSFVPCDKAELSPIDGVFTRMGAGDSWANGQVWLGGVQVFMLVSFLFSPFAVHFSGRVGGDSCNSPTRHLEESGHS